METFAAIWMPMINDYVSLKMETLAALQNEFKHFNFWKNLQTLKKIRTFLKHFFKKIRRKKIQISSTSTFQATFSKKKSNPISFQQATRYAIKI